MALTLAEIRAKLLEQSEKGKGGGGGGDNLVYPHWDIPENSIAKLRFTPDADSSNPYFWVERQMIRLPFSGIKGQPDSKPTYVQVPCIEMWPEMGMCPILAEVRPWFKDKSLEEMGRKYWKKKSYLMQGFVRENPLKEDDAVAGVLRRFIMSPQIFTLVKAALMDPELENLPTDFEAGLDFLVKKTSKGGYADYTTSTWARKESALTQAEMDIVTKDGGLFNLSQFLPKKPTTEDLVVMKEMFEASVDGQAYDTERWGKHFRPAGVQAPAGTATETAPAVAKPAPVSAKPTAPAASDDDIPFDADEPSTSASAPVSTPAAGKARADDLIAMIRNRNKAS